MHTMCQAQVTHDCRLHVQAVYVIKCSSSHDVAGGTRPQVTHSGGLSSVSAIKIWLQDSHTCWQYITVASGVRRAARLTSASYQHGLEKIDPPGRAVANTSTCCKSTAASSKAKVLSSCLGSTQRRTSSGGGAICLTSSESKGTNRNSARMFQHSRCCLFRVVVCTSIADSSLCSKAQCVSAVQFTYAVVRASA